MFKFGHKYIEPNKNGRLYSGVTLEEFMRIFNESANIVAQRGRRNVANYMVVSARFFDVMSDNTDDINDFKFGK